MPIQSILDDFGVIDEWDERYRYIIDLGRKMAPLPEAARTDAVKVRGCASQDWLISNREDNTLTFVGDSDAHIVRGLVAIILSLYSGKTARDILTTDAMEVFGKLGLVEHLTPQRSNGVRSMVERIRRDAMAAAQAA